MKIRYGGSEIEFSHRVNQKLKHVYISVDFFAGVILKSPPMTQQQAQDLILKKARWVLGKLKLVSREPGGNIVTGTRLLYMGRKYYTKVIEDPAETKVVVTFNYSSFKIKVNPGSSGKQAVISEALDSFYRQKAEEKIKPRVKDWISFTGLQPAGLRFRKLEKRWGSCTVKNEIIINTHAVQLPISLIDYIIVHELCHLEHRNHTKDFRREVRKYMPNCEEMADRISGLKC